MTAPPAPLTDIPPDRLLHRETLPGGSAWSRRLLPQQVLRLTDRAGTGCVSGLFFNADDPLERYNMPDTLKAQYTAFLTAGRVLFSDMGRVLLSVIADSAGWHDTITGCGDGAVSRARFGEGRYQELRNQFHRNARDNLLVELGKHGLGRRDLTANVNFFVRVNVDDQGRLGWAAEHRRPGAAVDLRAELPTLVVLSNTPHPLDPAPRYAPPPVELALWRADRPGPEDLCRRARAENTRGFQLTEAYLAERSGGQS